MNVIPSIDIPNMVCRFDNYTQDFPAIGLIIYLFATIGLLFILFEIAKYTREWMADK